MNMPTSVAGTPGFILVVEDDAALRSSLKFSLEMQGHRALAFASGAELLAEKALPERGCMVVDYRLPDGNGLELIAEVRKRGVGLPAILTATNPGRVVRERAEREGVQVVEKPLLDNALAEAIRAALNKPVSVS